MLSPLMPTEEKNGADEHSKGYRPKSLARSVKKIKKKQTCLESGSVLSPLLQIYNVSQTIIIIDIH